MLVALLEVAAALIVFIGLKAPQMQNYSESSSTSLADEARRVVKGFKLVEDKEVFLSYLTGLSAFFVLQMVSFSTEN